MAMIKSMSAISIGRIASSRQPLSNIFSRGFQDSVRFSRAEFPSRRPCSPRSHLSSELPLPISNSLTPTMLNYLRVVSDAFATLSQVFHNAILYHVRVRVRVMGNVAKEVATMLNYLWPGVGTTMLNYSDAVIIAAVVLLIFYSVSRTEMTHESEVKAARAGLLIDSQEWTEMWKDAYAQLKQLRAEIKDEVDDVVRAEMLIDIEGWKKRKGDMAKLLGMTTDVGGDE
jgi:hypothetical protein